MPATPLRRLPYTLVNVARFRGSRPRSAQGLGCCKVGGCVKGRSKRSHSRWESQPAGWGVGETWKPVLDRGPRPLLHRVSCQRRMWGRLWIPEFREGWVGQNRGSEPWSSHAGSKQDRRAANLWYPQPPHSGVLGASEVEGAAEVLGRGQGVLLCWEPGRRGARGIGEGRGS